MSCVRRISFIASDISGTTSLCSFLRHDTRLHDPCVMIKLLDNEQKGIIIIFYGDVIKRSLTEYRQLSGHINVRQATGNRRTPTSLSPVYNY